MNTSVWKVVGALVGAVVLALVGLWLISDHPLTAVVAFGIASFMGQLPWLTTSAQKAMDGAMKTLVFTTAFLIIYAVIVALFNAAPFGLYTAIRDHTVHVVYFNANNADPSTPGLGKVPRVDGYGTALASIVVSVLIAVLYANSKHRSLLHWPLIVVFIAYLCGASYYQVVPADAKDRFAIARMQAVKVSFDAMSLRMEARIQMLDHANLKAGLKSLEPMRMRLVPGAKIWADEKNPPRAIALFTAQRSMITYELVPTPDNSLVKAQAMKVADDAIKKEVDRLCQVRHGVTIYQYAAKNGIDKTLQEREALLISEYGMSSNEYYRQQLDAAVEQFTQSLSLEMREAARPTIPTEWTVFLDESYVVSGARNTVVRVVGVEGSPYEFQTLYTLYSNLDEISSRPESERKLLDLKDPSSVAAPAEEVTLASTTPSRSTTREDFVLANANDWVDSAVVLYPGEEVQFGTLDDQNKFRGFLTEEESSKVLTRVGGGPLGHPNAVERWDGTYVLWATMDSGSNPHHAPIQVRLKAGNEMRVAIRKVN